jgi:hypothetical protein
MKWQFAQQKERYGFVSDLGQVCRAGRSAGVHRRLKLPGLRGHF